MSAMPKGIYNRELTACRNGCGLVSNQANITRHEKTCGTVTVRSHVCGCGASFAAAGWLEKHRAKCGKRLSVDDLLQIGKVQICEDCWIWNGSVFPNGYGRYKSFRAHRLMYLAAFDKDPGELEVCHSCDVRHCVNPDHLWLGTQLDNMHDMIKKGRKVVHRGADHHMWGNPKQINIGDNNPVRKNPGCMQRGNQHWTRRMPDKVQEIATKRREENERRK